MKRISFLSPTTVVALLAMGITSVGAISAQDAPNLPSIAGQLVEQGQYTPGSISGLISAATPTPAASASSVIGSGANNGSGSRNAFAEAPGFQPEPGFQTAPRAGGIYNTYTPPQAFPSTNAQPLNPSLGHSQAAPTFSAPAQSVPMSQSYVSQDPMTTQGLDNFVVDDFQGSEFPMEYTEVQNSVSTPAANLGGKNVSTVLGVSALAFTRDYERNQQFSSGPANLFSRDVDHETIGGLDVNLARRSGNGKGWEFRYFQMFPDTVSSSVTPGPTTDLLGLGSIGDIGGASSQQVFDTGNFHALTRDTEINNFEFNLLRNGQNFTTRRNRAGVFEYLFGFRYFSFNEALNYESQTTNAGTIPGFPNPTRSAYLNSVENSLFGGQVGGRREIQLRNRLSLSLGGKAGLYNNSVKTRQRIDNTSRVDGTISNPTILTGTTAGQVFDVGGDTNDITFLGEVDLGLIFQISQRARARVGYRAIGVSNVALAADQIQNDFSRFELITDPNTDGDLLLHGGYFGLEFAY